MKTGFRHLITLATVFSLSAGAGIALAQAPPAQGTPQQGVPEQQPPTNQRPAPPAAPAEPQEPAAKSMSGELTNVDTEKKALTVKGSDGVETIFQYNDDTKVSGSAENVAGLATSSGSKVTVEYKQDGNDRLATAIEVEAKS
jgi:hypothetical protein